MLVFEEGGKPEYPEKNPWSKDESGNRTRATLMGGERSHHCAIPAPNETSKRLRMQVHHVILITRLMHSYKPLLFQCQLQAVMN